MKIYKYFSVQFISQLWTSGYKQARMRVQIYSVYINLDNSYNYKVI